MLAHNISHAHFFEPDVVSHMQILHSLLTQKLEQTRDSFFSKSDESGELLSSCTLVLRHLSESFNQSPLGQKLNFLYGFIADQLIYASTTRDIIAVEDSIELLRNVGLGWNEHAKARIN